MKMPLGIPMLPALVIIGAIGFILAAISIALKAKNKKESPPR